MMSSAVKGSPSDHFMPRRSWTVMLLLSGVTVKARAMFGMIVFHW
jgi:hypothetical protein